MPIKPNNERAEIAITFLWIVMAMEIIDWVIEFLNLMGNFIYNKKESSIGTITEGLFSFAGIVISTISIIFFLLWFYRAYENLRQITNVKYKQFWSVLSWFVPVIHLFMPYKIMEEIFIETENILNKKNNKKSLFIWWWLLFILIFVFPIISGLFKILHWPWGGVLFSISAIFVPVLSIVCAYLTIRIIKKMNARIFT
jgi:hypothetical protein